LRVLGEFCLKHEYWGKAQQYLQLSLTKQADPKTYRLLGLYYAKQNVPQKSLEYYQKAVCE